MLASAGSTYLHRYGVSVGSRIVVVTGCDAAYATALDLHAAGSDGCARRRRARRRDRVPDRRRRARRGSRSSTARPSWGRRVGWACAASSLAASSMERSWTAARSPAMRCSCPAATRRACISSRSRAASSRGTPVARRSCPTGTPSASARPGPAAASTASSRCSTTARRPASPQPALRVATRSGGRYERPRVTSARWARPARCDRARDRRRHVRSSTFQNDVTTKDLALAAREGFVSIEHIKRYTTAGMATDQGKTSNMNALAIVADGLARPLPDVGLTTFRMPYTPVTFGALAGYDRGDLFDPVRTTPMHEWARRHGAVFEDVGQWKRARYFPRDGERHAPGRRARVSRSARGVRHLRCVDARQDRGRGSRRRDVPVANVCQRLCEPRGRAGAATASCCATTASSTTTA